MGKTLRGLLLAIGIVMATSGASGQEELPVADFYFARITRTERGLAGARIELVTLARAGSSVRSSAIMHVGAWDCFSVENPQRSINLMCAHGTGARQVSVSVTSHLCSPGSATITGAGETYELLVGCE